MGSRDTKNETPVDADTFQQWVEHTASSREMTEHELLNRLVSAFWALDEMGDISLEASSGSGESIPDAESEREWFRDDPDPSEGPSGSAAAGGDKTSDPSETGLSEQFDTADLDPQDDLSPTEVELTRRIAELRRQIADLSLDVEQQRSRQEEYTDRLSDDITRLHSEVQSLDSRLEQADDDVADRVEAIEDALGDVEATQTEFETWIDEEFDQIEALFERILDTVREFDDRIAELESTVDTVADAKEDRETLDALRRQAVRKGVDTGRCESCETTVDLSMLSSPICPSCDEPFRDIEDTASWYPFSKPTLRTGTRPARPPHRD